MNFKNLHHQDSPLLICNVWDVASAKAAEQLHFNAIGTSSGAIAAMLGYRDGEEMSFEELEYIVKRIATNSNLPFSVDLESGYSRNPTEIVNHIKRLNDLGAIGVNLEDSIVKEKREFLDAEEFANTIYSVKEQLQKENINIFLNIRTDTFLLNHPNSLKESFRRIKLYENAGADGIFIPCIEKQEDILAVVASTSLPINVMCMPNLPDFRILKEIGVQRISMGNFLFNEMYQHFEKTLTSISKSQSFKSVFKFSD